MHTTIIAYLNDLEPVEGNKGFVIELINLFMKRMPKEIEILKQTFINNQMQDFRELAHKMHSTTAAIGAFDLMNICKKLEYETDEKVINILFSNLIDQYNETCLILLKEKELRQHAKTTSSKTS